MPLKPLLVPDIFEACELARIEYQEGRLSMTDYLLKLRELLNN